MSRQIIVISDMEGASGIFEHNRSCLRPGTTEWLNYGRKQMTSDLLAVFEAINAFGVEEIFFYDSHFAGYPEYNVELDRLPSNVKLADTKDRCFYWRRIRGQACENPIGVITVGQHARYGEPNAYFAHTIQSPPIQEVKLNGVHIGEIGSSVLSFANAPFVANIGCAASEKEARELSETVTHISVKSKSDNWEPSAEETYALIKDGVMKALSELHLKNTVKVEPPYKFEMKLLEGFKFDENQPISWKGNIENRYASWEAPSVEIGLEIFDFVRDLILDENE